MQTAYVYRNQEGEKGVCRFFVHLHYKTGEPAIAHGENPSAMKNFGLLPLPQASVPTCNMTETSVAFNSKPSLSANLQCRNLSVSCNVVLPRNGGGKESTLRCQAVSVESNPGVIRSAIPADKTLKAVIFDVDGTLCDSDPLHYIAFVELLKELGFQGGEPISEEFFIEHITGRDIVEVLDNLFPEWNHDKRNKFMEDKEARFRSLAIEQLKPVEGLETLCQWIKERGLHRAAVTNAPRENAELMISILGLSDFFEILVVGTECERAKPFPDPYLKALNHLGLSPDQAFVFEDSSTGLQAAVSAGMAAVGVATRNPEASLLKAGASFTIGSYSDPKLWSTLKGQM